ncbi:unnamed protein product [Urochloa decumbens]|uniref:F-box domain-containing protein n=1 Tax=Urochloa decumbens TaxID=240449 RepID=A0ABC8YJS5_9POAL
MLPADVLADVLSRLPPRGLAASRSVCTAWRDVVIDARRLLRADRLPLTLAGLFINYDAPEFNFAELFSRRRRPSSPAPADKPTAISYPALMDVRDHCNGLLLCYDGVLNPATGAWAPLPDCPPPPHPGTEDFRQQMYLAFDPAVSPHRYEGQFPETACCRRSSAGIGVAAVAVHPECLLVGDGLTGRWEERSFDRDDGGEIAGTVAEMRLDERFWMRRRNTVYWRGALYVHCEKDFVMRISFATNKYHMIKPPSVVCKYLEFNLGKSEKGVYYALVDDDNRFRVWMLAEPSYGQIEWTLTHDSGCDLFLTSLKCIPKDHGPWILHEVNSEGDENHAAAPMITEHKYDEWNSDDASVLHNEDGGCPYSGYVEMLAFHPYKEIIFLHRSLSRGLAYHLNSSRLEDLGNLCPNKMRIDDTRMDCALTPRLL